MANRAAFLTGPKEYPLKVDDAAMPEPEANEVIIKTGAVAINPCDAMIQKLGVLLKDFPCVMGEDVAGTVVSTGSKVTRFRPGDRVVGFASRVTFDRPFDGTFQLYTRVADDLAAHIPDDISDSHACVLPLALCTAAACLHAVANLALPTPTLDPPPRDDEVLLIWGASSSVGATAVQLARAAGYDVATTSGASNLDFCRRELGAVHAFDRASPSIVDDVVAALRGRRFAGAMCAWTDDASELACARIAHELGGRRFVATTKPNIPGMWAMSEGLPEDVEMGWCQSTDIRNEPAGAAIWQDWLTAALASGQMKCLPPPHVVGKGLDKIQEALDVMVGGVSAKKLVVEM